MTEHSSHMPRRSVGSPEMLLWVFGSRVPPRVLLQKQLLRPTRHLWNQQPTINHRQAAVLIIPLCLDLHALTGLQLNNHSSPRQLNIKGEATISGTHETQPHHVQKVLTESSNTKSFTATGHPKYYLKMISRKLPMRNFPISPHLLISTMDWELHGAHDKKNTHTNKFPHPTVGLPLH